MKIPLKHYFSSSHQDFDIEFSGDDSYDLACDPDKCRGFYAELSGKTVGLCAIDGRLFILLEEKAYEATSSFSIRHETKELSNNLIIESGTELHFITYENENSPVSTQFYSEDVEDADFGLWMSNVLNATERKMAILNSWSDGI